MILAKHVRESLSYDPHSGDLCRNGRAIGWVEKDGYRRTTLGGKTYSVHRLVWLYVYGHEPSGEIDHINGDRADNRIANLRDASSSQNGANSRRRRDNQSGYKGVGFHKSVGKWRARIKHERQERTLGYFETAEQAAAAYAEAARALFSDYARLA